MKKGIFQTGIKRSASVIVYLTFFAFIAVLLIDIYQLITTHNIDGLFITFMLFCQLVIILLANYMKKRHFLRLNDAFFYIAILFGFCSQILGEIFNFYELIPWWDTALHFTSGVIFGFMGIALILLLLPDDIEKNVHPIIIILFGLFFSVTVGVVWEFFEFGLDQLFGANAQKSFYITDAVNINNYYNSFGRFNDPGLVDTMGDLAICFVGGIIASLYSYISFKNYMNISSIVYDEKDIKE